MRCYDNIRLALLFQVEKNVIKRPPVPFRLLSIQTRSHQVLLMRHLNTFHVHMIRSTLFYNGSNDYVSPHLKSCGSLHSKDRKATECQTLLCMMGKQHT